jgi:hypothetical protein
MRLTVEERVFILKSYLKTMSYAHCRQSFFEKFRRQVPVKSVIAKMIKKFRKKGSLLDKNRNRQKSVLTRVDTARCSNGYFISNTNCKYRLGV